MPFVHTDLRHFWKLDEADSSGGAIIDTGSTGGEDGTQGAQCVFGQTSIIPATSDTCVTAGAAGGSRQVTLDSPDILDGYTGDVSFVLTHQTAGADPNIWSAFFSFDDDPAIIQWHRFEDEFRAWKEASLSWAVSLSEVETNHYVVTLAANGDIEVFENAVSIITGSITYPTWADTGTFLLFDGSVNGYLQWMGINRAILTGTEINDLFNDTALVTASAFIPRVVFF